MRSILIVGVLFLSACSSVPVSPWERKPVDPHVVQRSVETLNSTFVIRIWRGGEDVATLKRLLDAGDKEIRRIAAMVDEKRNGSEVSRLNNSNAQGFQLVSKDVAEMLLVAQSMYKRSSGAFDVTFVPIQEETEAVWTRLRLDRWCAGVCV
jgi:thiamine biosynthesis lipoprotein ApbE